jgi:hypothetical protein
VEIAERLLGGNPDRDLEAQAKKELDQSEGKPEKKGK